MEKSVAFYIVYVEKKSKPGKMYKNIPVFNGSHTVSYAL